MPRLDRMHEWRRDNAGRSVAHNILFFLFLPATGMPRVPRKSGKPGEDWVELRAMTLFDGLSTPQRRELRAAGTDQAFGPGDVIFVGIRD